MKTVVVLCLCIAVASGAPTPCREPTQAEAAAARRALPAIHHEEIHDDFGQFALRYVTAEGITYEERGRLVPNPDGNDYVLIYDGEYSFIGDDGVTYRTKYTTDIEGGYQVQGDHLPKAPEPVDVIEKNKISEVSLTTPITEQPKNTESAITNATPGARKLNEFPLEQHDEQEPRYPEASA